ncbi:MAG TPA: hypothetical protein VK853_05620 [Ilumatobacteraceae bacterium]|nr:hypothetical protein [Ilumatobacteraceae bacterium]
MSGQLLWEFVPDRRNLPPVLRSLIRQPAQRARLDGDALVFEGLRVHETYPNRDLEGRQQFRELKPKERSRPVLLSDIVRLAVYPVRGGWLGGADSHTARALYVVVDMHRLGDVRTVATVDRRLGIEPHDERALADALRAVAGEWWADGPADERFALDPDRLAEWG